jgi:ABC-2 type transport system ATP-binding protein
VDQVHASLPPLLTALSGHARPLDRLSTRQATLEDVFVTLTGRHLRD